MGNTALSAMMCLLVTGAHPNRVFTFEVKFYPMVAEALHEDYTRCDSCVSPLYSTSVLWCLVATIKI